jgi:hypothetical protein
MVGISVWANADAHLALPDFPGQAGYGPHPSIQRRPLGATQLDWMQPRDRGHHRQPRQRLGVDTVAFGVTRQKPAQVGRFGRGHPHTVWPRRPKYTAMGNHIGPVGSMTTVNRVCAGAPRNAACSNSARLSTVETTRRRARI